ncbi:MAG TPA: hypothetical protein VHV32_10040 [Candidatus Angelobacter sp.]|jgi:hypothetical protein|nr:hypothetical protein [Candidatus Angelobacter sp.]
MKTRWPVSSFVLVLLALLPMSHSAAQPPHTPRINQVQVEITKASRKEASVHWKITNNSEVAVYVYDVFLWGPAYRTESQQQTDKIVIDTAPVMEEPSCPPNRFPPVLLLMVGKGRSIEGDLTDDAIKDIKAKNVSLRISVGPEPNTVVSEAKRFFNSGCTHNPYDAIVRWGTILESNTIQLSSGPTEASMR